MPEDKSWESKTCFGKDLLYLKENKGVWKDFNITSKERKQGLLVIK